MRSDYAQWLAAQEYDGGTISNQLARVGRVEEHYGLLDRHYAEGTLQTIIGELTYSTEDERRAKPNPSRIPTSGNPRTNLASYKSAVVLYWKFLLAVATEADIIQPEAERPAVYKEVAEQRLSLERDMQAAVRRNINSLGGYLDIVDDGVERSVESGLIDITCRNRNDDSLVVVELKAGKADSRAVGQILGYMGDLAAEEGRTVSGILVAHDFDQRALSAAKIVPTLTLMRYSVEFRFQAAE